MCRMFGFTGRGDAVTLVEEFGQLSVKGKSIDGRGHPDGWGIGYYKGGVNLVKKAACAQDSSEYVKAAHLVEGASVVLAHLRKASPGTPITDELAHPFLHGHFLFCHNGSMHQKDGSPFETLDTILFFEKVCETSLKEAVRYFSGFVYTSLTCLLTDGETMWGYRGYTEREDYYTLYCMRTNDYVVFCSEPFTPGKWTLLQNGELVTVSPTLDLVREQL